MTINCWFKVHYANNVKHMPNNHIEESDLKDSVLKTIGLTAELINYVRNNYVNTKSDPVEILYREGSLLWRETRKRMKNKDAESIRICRAVWEEHILYLNDYDKEKTADCKRKIIQMALYY